VRRIVRQRADGVGPEAARDELPLQIIGMQRLIGAPDTAARRGNPERTMAVVAAWGDGQRRDAPRRGVVGAGEGQNAREVGRAWPDGAPRAGAVLAVAIPLDKEIGRRKLWSFRPGSEAGFLCGLSQKSRCIRRCAREAQ
jgi:hypothetical protein